MDELLALGVKRRRGGSRLGVLFLRAVVDVFAREGGVLMFPQGVVKLLECFGFVTRHREVDAAAFVIPVEGDADVTPATPIGSDFIVFLKSVEQVEGVFLAHVLDGVVIDRQGKLHLPPVMLPETRYELALAVPGGVEALLEQLISQQPRVRKAVHSFSGFKIDEAVGGGFLAQAVLCDDFVGDVGEFHSHVFGALEWCPKVEVGCPWS